MSHHSDEQQLSGGGSDSFWEPGNYKRTTRRLDDGHRLCTDLQALVAERADIEKAYAKSLRGWAKKWNDLIEKGPEYGTTEAAWKGSLVEADRLCELHLRVRDNLVNDVIQQIKNWQKDTYHKSMIQLKERKEMDEAFKKAQKPWAKLLQKVERTRLEYHAACKSERTAQNQERNASGDSSFSPDQVKKMAERVARCREEVCRGREKYQAALAEINAYNPRYIEDMTAVFERCQAMEAQRLLFFKDVLFTMHKCLNVSQDPTLPQIYEEFHATINNADHQKDLKWWANNHGVNMPMAWPTFEEYTEEFRDIAKGKSKESIPTGPITLIHQRPVGEDLHMSESRQLLPVKRSRSYWMIKPFHFRSSSFLRSRSELPPAGAANNSKPAGGGRAGTLPAANNHSHAGSEHAHAHSATIDKKHISAPIAVTIKKLQVFAVPPSEQAYHSFPLPALLPNGSAGGAGKLNSPSKEAVKAPGGGATTQAAGPGAGGGGAGSGGGGADNPFDGDEEWEEEEGGALVDTGEPGVPVRALYDYTGAESDELSFAQGEVFEKLEEEDEQGWCKGRKDGRVGLYPANYVEPVHR